MDDRELRTSIDHESKIRDQIAKLTGQLEDVLEKTEQSSNPSLPILMELEENHSTEAEKRKAPKKKKSLKDKDGPKRTISVQLPPEVFEKIQQDELRDDMEANKTLENFLASQGLESYTNVLKRRGFKTINDLANLNEEDIDFKVKPVHKTRLLFVASSQRSFMEEDGKAVPETKKVKPAGPDPEDEPKKGPRRTAGRKPQAKGRAGAKAGAKPGAKAGAKPGAKAAKAGAKPAKKAGAAKKSPPKKRAPPGKKPAAKKSAAEKDQKEETEKPDVAAAKEQDEVIDDDVSKSLTEPTSEVSDFTQADEAMGEPMEPQDELMDPTFEVSELNNDAEFPEYPEIVSIPGLALPPQPPNITRLVFGNGPFGITVYGTGNGLVVTHVEPEGSGAEMRVEVGDHVVELNGVEVPPNISDREFVEQLMSKARPVVLGFKRNGKDFTSANLEMMDDAEEGQLADAEQTETYTVGGISMDEIDPEKNLADLFPSAGLEIYLDALKEMGAEKMEDLAYLRRSDLMDLDIDIAPADKKKLLELGLVAFLTKEGLADCVAYIRSVGVDMVDDLVYLKQSDVALMDLKQEYKDRLMDVLGRDS